jgi:hypothetical protein
VRGKFYTQTEAEFDRVSALSAARCGRIGAWWKDRIAPLIGRDGLASFAAENATAAASEWLPGFTTRMRWPYRAADPAVARAIGESARRELPELRA